MLDARSASGAAYVSRREWRLVRCQKKVGESVPYRIESQISIARENHSPTSHAVVAGGTTPRPAQIGMQLVETGLVDFVPVGHCAQTGAAVAVPGTEMNALLAVFAPHTGFGYGVQVVESGLEL